MVRDREYRFVVGRQSGPSRRIAVLGRLWIGYGALLAIVSAVASLYFAAAG